jgi:O-antigen ligase
MILRLLRNFWFSLATFAFVGHPVKYVGLVFTPTTRWIFLLLLLGHLVIRRRFLMGLNSVFGVSLLAYCIWCMLTSSWSEVPELSLAKSTAFVLVSLTFVSAGYFWVEKRSNANAIGYLIPIVILTLCAGLMGNSEATIGPNLKIYGGLTHPNALGAMIVMSLPVLLWIAYKERKKPLARWIWIALVAVALAVLMRTGSRASTLGAAMVLIFFFMSSKIRVAVFYSLLIIGALLIAASVDAELIHGTYHDYLLKGQTEKQGIFFSRERVWNKSYENAIAGGWFGAGYGVTIGDTVFEGGLTAQTYGREKGNTELAIVEETGMVGLTLYVILLLTLFTPLISAYIGEKDRDAKVVLGLITGSLCGITVTSLFEAWWVAPGSPESVFFWGLAGVGLCLAEKSRRASRSGSPRPIARLPVLSPASPL